MLDLPLWCCYDNNLLDWPFLIYIPAKDDTVTVTVLDTVFDATLKTPSVMQVVQYCLANVATE